ncbi:MAG TPA: hypothetical protein VIL36_09410 [Acidimicrobiales bacterium]
MQPSSDLDYDPPPSALRRYGPLAAVLVVIALIAGASVVLSGDDGDEETGDQAAEPVGEGYPDGVVTWSMAQEDESLDVEFPDTCDPETGKVAIPFFFAPECTAIAEPDPDAEPIQGVTEDTIKIVLWLPNDNDVIFSFIKQALGFDDTVEEIRETQLGLVEIFQTYYNTYGREVEVEFLQASGAMMESQPARADAVKAASMKPAAVLGGPLLANTWTQELHNQGIICVACPGISDPEPTAFGLVPSETQLNIHARNYVNAKLKDGTADFAGGDLQGRDRVFGMLTLAQSENSIENHGELKADLESDGIPVAEDFTFELNLGGAAEFATSTVTAMKEAGVTTVLVRGDPITMGDITREATKQNWFPEWVMITPQLLDTNAGAQLVDKAQWEHAFGISYLPPSSEPELNPAYKLYEWFHGEPPPAEGSLLLTYPQIALFFTGLHLAGPNPTPDNVRQAAFAFPPTPRARTQPSLNYGTELWDGDEDYQGIDDLVELWYDPDARVVDEFGNEITGAYQYVDGAKRYYADEWTDELKVFDPDGAVTKLTEVPPEEEVPDYPSPAGG